MFRQFGAKGDGAAVDSPAINHAIDAAAAAGGGTVSSLPGSTLSYSIRLKSKVGLYLDHGAVILAGPTPLGGTTTGGYDAAEPQGEWEPYQDYGHNHWHNSLIWGEGLDGVSITGPGLIWGKGLSRGWDWQKMKASRTPPSPAWATKPSRSKIAATCCCATSRILKGGRFAHAGHRRGQPDASTTCSSTPTATASISTAAATCASPTAP